MSQEGNNTETNYPVVRQSGVLTVQQGRNLPADDVITKSLCQELIREAIGMLKKSYTPYSNFKVGAALLSKNKNIYTGCNIENATYTPTNCAERTAFFKAVSEGDTEFTAIAIVGGLRGKITDYCPPCGVCRQVMMEFCNPKKFIIILARSEDDYCAYTLEELLPLGFSAANISE